MSTFAHTIIMPLAGMTFALNCGTNKKPVCVCAAHDYPNCSNQETTV